MWTGQKVTKRELERFAEVSHRDASADYPCCRLLKPFGLSCRQFVVEHRCCQTTLNRKRNSYASGRKTRLWMRNKTLKSPAQSAADPPDWRPAVASYQPPRNYSFRGETTPARISIEDITRPSSADGGRKILEDADEMMSLSLSSSQDPDSASAQVAREVTLARTRLRDPTKQNHQRMRRSLWRTI